MKHLALVLILVAISLSCREKKVLKIDNYRSLDSTFHIQLKHYFKSIKQGNLTEMKKYFYPDYFICLKIENPNLKELPDSILVSMINGYKNFSKKNNVKIDFYCGKIKRRLLYEDIIVFEFDSVAELKSKKKNITDVSNSFAFSNNNGVNWTFLPGDNEEVYCILEKSLPQKLSSVLRKE